MPKIQEKFLPIGTVVMLKEAKRPIMITSYCVFAVATKKEVYDYGGCFYPVGILDPNLIQAFNHNQIEKVLYMGYETDEHKKFSEGLNNNYDEIVKMIKSGKKQDINTQATDNNKA